MTRIIALMTAAAISLALAGTAQAQTARSGKVVGLAIIVEYQDHKSSHTRQQVEEFFNRVGGMRGSNQPISVYDFYKRFSEGRLELTHVVAPVVTLPFKFAERGSFGSPRIYWPEAKKVLDTMNFNLSTSGVTLNSRGEPLLITMLVAAPIRPTGLAATGNGISRTAMRHNPRHNPANIRVVVHEIGHAFMGWGHAGASAMARDLMKGGWVPNPYFRHMAGWVDPVDITNMPAGTKLTLTANSNQVFVYRRNANEAFYIEARQSDSINGVPIGKDESGLLIWHYNQAGARGTAANATGFWRIELVHANGRTEMGSGNRFALFRAGVRTRFDRATTPSSAWRDGTPSGLNISRISGAGNTMSFTLGFENYADEMIPEVKFLDDIYSSLAAPSNVVVTLNQNLTLNTLVNLPAPRTPGVTVTIRSANPARPVTITRGTVGNLFTVPSRTTLILENIIIDGGGRGNFISSDEDDEEEAEADENGNIIAASPVQPADDSEEAPAAGTAAVAGTLVRVNSGGTFVMRNGAVLRNNINSGNGGGVFINGNGRFTMNGGEISGNTSGNEAGGVYINTNAAFTMSGGIINGNTANNSGGVYARRSTFTMSGGQITGNTAAANGGVRVHGQNAVFTMTGGEISGNNSNSGGRGVHIASNGVFNFHGGVVAGTGRNLNNVVSGSNNLNTSAPRNAVIIAWNRPSGNVPNYTAGANTDLTVSAGGTAAWANQNGVLGISYTNGANRGWIRAW